MSLANFEIEASTGAPLQKFTSAFSIRDEPIELACRRNGPGRRAPASEEVGTDEDQLLKLMNRWRHEALQTGHAIERVVVAYEAGHDGFWLARWLRERGVEAYVMHASSIAVSREHRRAKTDRLDTELLMRAFLGWLRGERRHCSMAAIPTIEEEDAKRPNREHEKLVGDRTRIMNRMKSTLSRFGIRGFKPTLRKADEKLSELRTAEGTLLPENTRAELRRDMTRLRVVREQLKEIEQQRLRKLEAAAPAKKGPHVMVRLIARVIGIGIETPDMLVTRSCPAIYATARRSPVTLASPAHRTKAASGDVKRGWRAPAMRGCGAG